MPRVRVATLVSNRDPSRAKSLDEMRSSYLMPCPLIIVLGSTSGYVLHIVSLRAEGRDDDKAEESGERLECARQAGEDGGTFHSVSSQLSIIRMTMVGI